MIFRPIAYSMNSFYTFSFERWEELKEETNENIQSEEGILKRQTRSIQTEGHFGDIKENENFRRFHYRSLIFMTLFRSKCFSAS